MFTIGVFLVGMSVGGFFGFKDGLKESEKDLSLSSESLPNWLKYGKKKAYRRSY